ncbi:hypothetical protein [Xanthobacter pseudotagetidis]|uniref:hypothetical protein n=1 Tax=Xanthobacter pseudotagetidis TaxID=3119911 RepID=UPI003726A268
MANLFLGLAILAIVAALCAWGVAAREALKIFRAERPAGLSAATTLFLVVFWPFAVRARDGASAPAADAARMSKATVAFFVAVTLLVASAAAYTNLTTPRPGAVPAQAPAKS